MRQYLDACLQSILHAAAHFAGKTEVIVFDNDSRDGTLPLLKPRYPEVVWLASDRNLGFGSGCNRGAAVSTQPLLLFLNPDTLLSEDTLQVMWDFFAGEANIGIAGCKIVNRDGTLQLACKRSFPSPQVAVFKLFGLSNLFPKSRVFGRYNLTYLDENLTHEVDAVSGSFLCIERDLFRRVGGFDEDFFMYGEDLDLCFRVKALGKRNLYYPKTRVIHFKGESAKSRPIRTFLYFYEAMVIFSKKHFELRTLPLALFYAGIIGVAFFNFISARLQKWPRWMADLLIVNLLLAVVTSVYMRSMGMLSVLTTSPRLYLFWHALISSCVVLPLAYIGEYGRKVQGVRTVGLTLMGSFMGFFALSYFIQEEAYSRVVFALTGLLSIALLLAWRVLSFQGGKLYAKVMGSTRRVAIVGTSEKALRLAQLLETEALPGYEFVGFVQLDDNALPPLEMRRNLIGGLDTLAGLVQKMDLNEIIIALEEGAYQTALKVLSEKVKDDLAIKLLVGEPGSSAVSLVDLNFRR